MLKSIARMFRIGSARARFEEATKRGDTEAAERARRDAMSQIRAFNQAFESKAKSPSDAIASLGENIIGTALLSTQPVNEAWPVKPMPAKANYVVRMEMLMFIIHMVNRFALAAAGTEAMAALRRAVAQRVMPSIIKASFDTRSAKPGFDAEEWQRRMIDEALGMLDEAEAEYSECRDLGGDMGPKSLASDDIIVGRLANRIFESTDIPDDLMLRMLIGSTAVGVLARSGLKEQAEATSQVIARSSV